MEDGEDGEEGEMEEGGRTSGFQHDGNSACRLSRNNLDGICPCSCGGDANPVYTCQPQLTSTSPTFTGLKECAMRAIGMGHNVPDHQQDLDHRDACDVCLRGRDPLRHGHGACVSWLGV